MNGRLMWARALARGWADGGVALAAGVVSTTPYWPHFAYLQVTPPSSTIVLPLLGCAGLVCRRRWPVEVFAWTLFWSVASLLLANSPKVPTVPVMVALYTMARWTPWSRWVPAAVVETIAVVIAQIAAGASGWSAVGSSMLWTFALVAAGIAVRNRVDYMAAVEDRARRAEESRDAEARRRVAEERIKIARDLHDVLAHSIAVINVQSGVAAHLLRSRPAAAERALTHINDASHAALSELRALLGILRDEGDLLLPVRPPPSLDQLEGLVTQVRAAGLTGRTHICGDLSRVPPEVGVVAYRVLQEALTNVLKHAKARQVDVTVESNEAELRLEVHDDGRGAVAVAAATTSCGYGRIGMRERVRALGGVLRDGPNSRGYRVEASIPLERSRTEAAS